MRSYDGPSIQDLETGSRLASFAAFPAIPEMVADLVSPYAGRFFLRKKE
jgi:hypothetical protein